MYIKYHGVTTVSINHGLKEKIIMKYLYQRLFARPCIHIKRILLERQCAEPRRNNLIIIVCCLAKKKKKKKKVVGRFSSDQQWQVLLCV